MTKKLARFAILPIASIAVYSTDCYAVYEKDFHVNVLDSEFDTGITSGNSLKVAAFTLKELYRIHLTHVLNDNILKKYDLKTITEVIPTEIIAQALNIHTNDDKSVDYNNEENKALECLGKTYKKLEQYDQSNFNYVLLINLLDSCVGGAGSYEILVEKAKTKIGAVTENGDKKYISYQRHLKKAENDLKQYFDDLKLFDFINQIKMRANIYSEEGHEDKIVRQIKRDMNPKNTRSLALVSDINLKLDNYTQMRTKLSDVAGTNDIILSVEEIYDNNSIYNREQKTMTAQIRMTYPKTFGEKQIQIKFLGYISNETNVDPENLKISTNNTSGKGIPNLGTELEDQMKKFTTVTTEIRDRLTTINQQRDLIFGIEDDGTAKQMLLLSDILNIQPNEKGTQTNTWFRYNLIIKIMNHMWGQLENYGRKRTVYYNETTEEAIKTQLPTELSQVEELLTSLKTK